MFYVYALLSEDGTTVYKGLTENIERRLKEHERGQNKTTRAFGKFRMILLEVCDSRIEARSREKYLKSGVGREYLRGIIDKLDKYD